MGPRQSIPIPITICACVVSLSSRPNFPNWNGNGAGLWLIVAVSYFCACALLWVLGDLLDFFHRVQSSRITSLNIAVCLHVYSSYDHFRRSARQRARVPISQLDWIGIESCSCFLVLSCGKEQEKGFRFNKSVQARATRTEYVRMNKWRKESDKLILHHGHRKFLKFSNHSFSLSCCLRNLTITCAISSPIWSPLPLPLIWSLYVASASPAHFYCLGEIIRIASCLASQAQAPPTPTLMRTRELSRDRDANNARPGRDGPRESLVLLVYFFWF